MLCAFAFAVAVAVAVALGFAFVCWGALASLAL
jgi:hypothetical protein